MCIASYLEYSVYYYNIDFTVYQTGYLFPFNEIFLKAIGILLSM
jgi:hypothetical protein